MRSAETELSSDVPPEAVSIWDVLGPPRSELLPEWYMPAAQVGTPPVRPWWRLVALVLIVSFLAINAYGLCSTYGFVGLG